MNAAPAPTKPRIFQIVIKSLLSPTEFGMPVGSPCTFMVSGSRRKVNRKSQKTGSFSYFEKLPVSLPKDSIFCVEVSMECTAPKPPLAGKGRWQKSLIFDGGDGKTAFLNTIPQSRRRRDCSLYAREPWAQHLTRCLFLCYQLRDKTACFALATTAGSVYWRSNSDAMGRPMGTPSRRNTIGPGSVCLPDRWKWVMPVAA